MTILYNTSNTAIDIDDFGLTVPAMGTSDISHIRQAVIANCSVLIDNVTNSVITVVNEQTSPTTYWSIVDALAILELGVNGAQVGIAKPTRPGIIDGNYYGVSGDAPLVDDTIPANHLNAIPVNYLGVGFNRIGICVTNAVANTECRLGVYENNDGLPGKLLLDAGVVPTDTVGNKEIVIDFTTPSDWCFLCTWTSNAIIGALSTTSTLGVLGNLTNSISDAIRHIHTDYTYVANTALPSTFPNTAVASSSYPPFVWFRKV